LFPLGQTIYSTVMNVVDSPEYRTIPDWIKGAK